MGACERWMKLRLGKEFNSLQNPPIRKHFKRVRQSNPSGTHLNFWQWLIFKWVREGNSRISEIDIRLGQEEISNRVREGNSFRTGIDIKLEHCIISNRVREGNSFSSGIDFNLEQFEICKRVRREGNSFGSGINIRLGQRSICKWVRECKFRRSGIDIRRGHLHINKF